MKVVKWLDKYFEVIYLLPALVTIVLVMSAQILSRKLLGASLAWSEELCRHLFIGMGLWGISYTIKQDTAIKFDLILGYLPPKGKQIMAVISNTIIAVFFCMLILPAFNVYKSMATISATALPYNMNVVYGLVIVGVFMVIIRSVQQVINNGKLLLRKTTSEEGESK